MNYVTNWWSLSCLPPTRGLQGRYSAVGRFGAGAIVASFPGRRRRRPHHTATAVPVFCRGQKVASSDHHSRYVTGEWERRHRAAVTISGNSMKSAVGTYLQPILNSINLKLFLTSLPNRYSIFIQPYHHHAKMVVFRSFVMRNTGCF